jgi:2-oxoglutarate dehydrogenase E1 component
MGSWTYVESRLRELGTEPRYVGRPERASPAEGYAETHEKEQRRIVTEAVSQPAARTRRGRKQQQT